MHPRGSAEESFYRAKHAFAAAIAAVFIAGIFIVLTRGTPDPIPTPAVTSVQPGAWDKFPVECRATGVDIAHECLEGLSTQERDAMTCQHEDGNEDGSPCIRIDPVTGFLYYVDSSEYRR